MSISKKFENLVNNTRTTNDVIIADRYKKITKRINWDFRGISSETLNSRYVGSYGRGTAFKEVSDIDMLIELPYATYKRFNEYFGNGQSALLQTVKDSISNTFPTTKKGGDGQVVVVEFSDGMKFDVLPTFINDDKSYTYPDSNNGGRWRVTNPIAEINAINYENKRHNSNVKRLVRIMKAWRKTNNVPISGLLLETLAMDFLDSYQYANKTFLYYDFMTKDFLEYLSKRNPNQQYWKAWGSGQFVYRTGNFEYKAKQGYLKAAEAIDDERNYPSLANDTWKKIFGTYFTGE